MRGTDKVAARTRTVEDARAVKRTLLRSLGISAVILGVWTILGAYFVTQDLVIVQLRGSTWPIDEIAIIGVLSTVLWVLLSPPILYLTQRRGAALRGYLPRLALVILVFAVVRALIGALFVPYIETRPLQQKDFGRAVAVQFHSNVTIISLIVIARAAYDVARAMREKDRRALKLESQLARAQLEQLRGQLQPHFLFNAINGIAALVHTDAERADEMLMELAALLRTTLDLGRNDTIPLQQELALVDHYLRIQTMRFEDRLRVTRTIDPAALDCDVPALLLQPLLENSLRHVIARRPEGGAIEIRAVRHDARLVLQVADDGPGFDATTTKLGVGVSNTIARLEQLYRGEARIAFARESGRFVVTIYIPVKESA
jgi:sensor histidine kinase YesM